MKLRGWVAGLVLLPSAAAPAAAVAAEEAYVGTVAVTSGAQPASAPLRLTIRGYTSDDQAFAMAEKLHKGGQAAAVAEMAKGDAGTVRLGEQSFRATMVREQKTEGGRILRIVTDRPLQLGAGRPAGTPPPDALGYLELKLSAAGEGSGRLLTAVKAAFDSEGYVVPESLGETWTVSGVKPGP